MELMVNSDVKTIWVHYGMMRIARKLVDMIIYPFKCRLIWTIRVYFQVVGGAKQAQKYLFHNMYKCNNMGTEFYKVVILKLE